MISRHPAALNWLQSNTSIYIIIYNKNIIFHFSLFSAAHNFFLCRLNISQIAILDYYGGPHYVNVEDYYRVNLDDNSMQGINDNNIDSSDLQNISHEDASAPNEEEINIKIKNRSKYEVINIIV